MQTLSEIRKGISRTIQHRSDPNRNIINLSKHSFTKGQCDLLNKKLNFCPTPEHYNKSLLRKDFEIFNKKIKSKAFFSHKTYKNKKPNQQTKNQTLKVKPIGNPKRTIELLKRSSKLSKKILWKDFQIKRNYLKVI